MFDFFGDADSLFKEVEISHASVNGPVLNLFGSGVTLLQISDDCLMQLETQLLLDLATNGSSNLGCKAIENLLFIIINGYVAGLKMADVNEHFKWVTKCHQEVV